MQGNLGKEMKNMINELTLDSVWICLVECISEKFVCTLKEHSYTRRNSVGEVFRLVAYNEFDVYITQDGKMVFVMPTHQFKNCFGKEVKPL